MTGEESGEPADRTLAAAGEFAVIDRLVSGRVQGDAVALGPGDDAAVVTASDGRVAVSTDMLVQDRHFRLDWSSPHDIGRKAIAQNAADIEAMGGRATAFVVAFGAPSDTSVEAAAQLADGLWDEARRFGGSVVGGDLVSAPLWVVSVTVLGDLGGRSPVCRSGARPGHTVAVAGTLGRSAAGLALLQHGTTDFAGLRQAHLTPQPPYGQGARAAEHGATSMTDVSDGLLADLGHIATASGVSIDLDTEGLQEDRTAVADAAVAVGADPWQWVLGGGEDHALVATFAGDPPSGWRAIGRVHDGPAQVLVDGTAWGGTLGWQSYG